MRSKSLSTVWITTGVSLIGASVCLPGGSAALAQEGACGTNESDPVTYEEPSGLLPAYCFGPEGPGPNVCTDDGCILDVLVVYTPAARIEALAAGTTINDDIGEAIDAMNIAFVNSQIPSFVRLMGTAEVPYDETDDTGGTEALFCLVDRSCMPLAHVLRNELKADIVSLFVTQIPLYAGITAPQHRSFSVVERFYAARVGAWVFAHETGHNLRADHEGLNPPGPCHAYVRQSSPSFSTIMRHNVVVGIIQHYSNPAVSYLGVPTGLAGFADNASCIRLYAPNRGNGMNSDCNGNGFCDAHDIAVGYSQDYEHNGIPDECTENGALAGCCLEGTCTYKTELSCLYQGGMYHSLDCGEDCNLNAVDDACESPGACCGLYGGCIEVPEDCCLAESGTFKGAGARCGGDIPPNGIPDGCESEPFGACCHHGMLCNVWLESYCTSQGGTFGGAGTYCEDCNGNGWPAPCEGPTTQEYGACCNGDGACTIATECSCHGQFGGVGTTCESVGACCFGTTCTATLQTCCTDAGGVFKGANTDCRDCTGNEVPDACEGQNKPLRACCLDEGYCELRTEECCELDEGIFKPSCLQCEVCDCPLQRPPP